MREASWVFNLDKLRNSSLKYDEIMQRVQNYILN